MVTKYKNNASSTLASGISNSQLTLNVQPGHGARFPSLGVGDILWATIFDVTGTTEIVKVTAVTGDTLTLSGRGLDGTTAATWPPGAGIEMRLNAGILSELQSNTATAQATADAASLVYGETISSVFTSKVTRVVNSIAALKALDKTKYTRAFVTGYYAAGDGGGGVYWYDSTDTTSVDNGGTVIVASDGGRWKLFQTGRLSPKQFGAKGDGVTVDTTAFTNLAATGKEIWLPYGDYVIDAAVTIAQSMFGGGADDGETTLTLTSSGQLIVGDEHARWDGFFVKSAVNNKTFIVCAFSYWSFNNFRLEKVSSATGQEGIRFDATARSVYFARVENFKIKLDYPIRVTGNSAQVFNANKIGTGTADYWQSFASAITIDGVSAIGANNFGGYFEAGTNVFAINAGAFSGNRFNGWLDAVTRLIITTPNITEPNYWQVKNDQFITAGAGTISSQVLNTNKAQFRAYLGPDQIVNDATFTKIQFAGKTFDDQSDYDTANFHFTARHAMRLRVSAQADVNTNLADKDRIRLAIYKNGSSYSEASLQISGSNGGRLQHNDILPLAADDTVEIYVWADQAAGSETHLVAGGSAATYFAGHEL